MLLLVPPVAVVVLLFLTLVSTGRLQIEPEAGSDAKVVPVWSILRGPAREDSVMASGRRRARLERTGEALEPTLALDMTWLAGWAIRLLVDCTR